MLVLRLVIAPGLGVSIAGGTVPGQQLRSGTDGVAVDVSVTRGARHVRAQSTRQP
jgi:hypothetical protein